MNKIVLLHGLAAGKSFFDGLKSELGENFDALTFDLLGFGQEMYAKGSFTLIEHLEFIKVKIDSFSKEPVILLGHSMGAVLAIHFTEKYPDRVLKLILLTPVLGRDRKDLEEGFLKTKGGWAKMLLKYPKLSFVSCKTLCKFRLMNLFYFLKPRYVSSKVFRDYIRHSWTSVSKTFENIILDSPAMPVVEKLNIPTLNIVGDKDSEICSRTPANQNIKTVKLPGAHYLPLKDPDLIASEIKKFLL